VDVDISHPTEPQHHVWAKGSTHEHDATFIGWWIHDDDRPWYRWIRIAAAADGRFCPYVPYWSGFREPEFGTPSTFPRVGTLKDAAALCETYLLKDEKDW
jgi:hypothetical protein